MITRAVRRASTAALLGLWAAGAAWASCAAPEHGAVDIYPTAELLPENLLRIYVYYPRPMGADQGFDHVRVLDSAGAPVSGVFLAGREDLWSPDRRRLTLLLDPGRVKTGLVANETLGRAFVPGQSYAFEVSGDALDAFGCPLGVDTRHVFEV
ncbi:MAG: hypothetical protein AAF729_13165, partial [Pseudomonadota bacterium]